MSDRVAGRRRRAQRMLRLLTTTIVAGLLVACTAPAAPATPATPGAIATATPQPAPVDLQRMLDDARLLAGAPGALGLLHRGEDRWFVASGTADTDGTVIDAATRFRIGSITKPIVALLVADAAAAGELSLDDVVGDILPGVVRAEPPVTVRQLLDHTSGIFDEGNEGGLTTDIERLTDRRQRSEAEELFRRYRAGEAVIASPEILVALAETHDRYFEPGTDYHYSNTNYQLAGLVLVAATGRTLADLLDERLASRLGLERLTIAPPDVASPELRGYVPDRARGALRDTTDDLATFGNGASGGIVASPGELLATIEAIATGGLLPEDLAGEMTIPNLGSYGLGVATYDLECGRYLGHAGLVNGTTSIALASPDGAAGVVIAFNFRGPYDIDMTALAERVLCGR